MRNKDEKGKFTFTNGKHSKNVKHNCKECDKEISSHSESGLCKSCVVKGDRHPLFGKIKEKHHAYIERPRCLDCGKQLYRIRAKRCQRCAYIGKGNPSYIDGRTALASRIRKCEKTNNWRKAVFERDRYTCQDCTQMGKKLEAHHKKEFRIILKEFLSKYNMFSPVEDKDTLLRLAMGYNDFWNIDNGQTLCKSCHSKTRGYVKNA